MTSTNDGKNVKCNQISGQKGKSYYIELYKSLDARLRGECVLRERTAAVCAAWRAVRSLCLNSAPDTHAHLLSWLQRHTAKTILQTEWQSASSKDEHSQLEQAINDFTAECVVARGSNPGPAWECQLLQRGAWFKRVLSNPWGHPVLKTLLDPLGRPTDEQILEWLKEERGVMFVTRLRVMAAGHCDDLALLLAAAVMGRVRRDMPLQLDHEQTDEHKDKPVQKTETESPTFREILMSEAGFTVDVWELLTDIEFVLLHKAGKSSQCIDLAKRTPLRNGYQLVERLQSRLVTSPREKKLWKNARDVAILIAQVVIARCMVVGSCSGPCRSALYCCARSLARLLPPRRLPLAAASLAAPASTARHLHTLAAAVHAECSGEMKPFVCELYIRAITAGMNELERLKVKTETEAEARLAEQTLAVWFVALGELLVASGRVRAECALTAFSLHPAPAMYDLIRSAPDLNPTTTEKLEPKPDEATSEFGSWASDSRTKTNLVKTSETLNIKKTEKHSNVLSTAILTEGEALGLSPELCQDLAVLLSGPRLKTLSWDMDRETLLSKCLGHMERTHGGTRALTTELRFLNLDPSHYQHLPEDDEDENDIYYGIEKGYEHLVEFHEDTVFDNERTETACSSDTESDDTVLARHKKKITRIVDSSDQEVNQLNPPEGNKTEKKERQNSKERSKNKDKDRQEKGEKSSNQKKDRRERKKEKKRERRKKKAQQNDTNNQPLGSLSSLVGMKVASVSTAPKVPTISIKPVPSISDNEGRLAMNSEGNESEVVFDGHYSMDEIKSPEKATPINRTSAIKVTPARPLFGSKKPGNQKSVNTIPAGMSMVNEQVRKCITKILNIRRQRKALDMRSVKAPNVNVTKVVAPPKSNAIQNREIVLTGQVSPKVVNIPEIPKSYINKKQIELDDVRKHASNVSPNLSVVRKEPTKPIVKNKITSTISRPINVPKALNNETIKDTAGSLQHRVTNILQKSSNTTTDRLKPNINSQTLNTQQIPAADASQQTFHDFLKELQKTINAGTGLDNANNDNKNRSSVAIKETGRVSRLPSNIQHSQIHETNIVPQCAKQIMQQKKVDALNTFSRLSYLHKSKITEKTKQAILYDPREERALNSQIAEHKHGKMKYHHAKNDTSRVDNAAAKSDNSPSVTLRKIDKTNSVVAMEHPVISDILHKQLQQDNLVVSNSQQQRVAPSTISSSLTNKDQENVLLLLRQQGKMNVLQSQVKMAQINVPFNAQSPTVTLPPPNKYNHTQLDSATPNHVTSRFIVSSRNSQVVNTAEHFQTVIKPVPTVAKAASQQNLKQEVNKTPTTDSKNKHDWESVMNAIRAQKTPCRGPNALDLALKKDSVDWAFTDTILRKQRITRTHSSGDLNVTNKPAFAKRNMIPAKPKTNISESNTPHLTDKIKINKHEKPIIINQTVISTPENRKNTKQDSRPKITSPPHIHKKPTQTLPTKKPSGLQKKQFTCVVQKEEDPFISGIKNSDYDLLEELMDDDLRQEIGELSSDDESYGERINAHKMYENNVIHKTLPARSDTNPAMQEKQNEVGATCIQNSSYGTIKKTAVMSNLTKTIKPAHPLVGTSIITGTKVKLPKCVPDSETALNNMATRPPTIIQNLATNIVLTPPRDTKQLLTSNCNISLNQPIIQPSNIFVTPTHQQTSLQNVVIIGSELVYDPYTMQAPIHTVGSVPHNAYVAINAPNVELYQTTEYSAPVVDALIIGNASMPTDTQPTADANDIPMLNNVDAMAKPPVFMPNSLETNSDQNKLNISTEVISLPKTGQQFEEPATNMEHKSFLDVNSNNNSERQELPQVQEKQKTKQVKKLSNKHKDLIEKKSIKYDEDEERLKMKRMDLINREINHRCDYQPIPLSYAPQHCTVNPEIAREQAVKVDSKQTGTTTDANKRVGVPVCEDIENYQTKELSSPKSHDNSKENKYDSIPDLEDTELTNVNVIKCDASEWNDINIANNQTKEIYSLARFDNNVNNEEIEDDSIQSRRILLRSSNKLTTQQLKDDMAKHNVAKKTKLRLKGVRQKGQHECGTNEIETQAVIEDNGSKAKVSLASKKVKKKISPKHPLKRRQKTRQGDKKHRRVTKGQEGETVPYDSKIYSQDFDSASIIPKVIISKKRCSRNNPERDIKTKQRLTEYKSKLVQNSVSKVLPPVNTSDTKSDSYIDKESKELASKTLIASEKFTNLSLTEPQILSDEHLLVKFCTKEVNAANIGVERIEGVSTENLDNVQLVVDKEIQNALHNIDNNEKCIVSCTTPVNTKVEIPEDRRVSQSETFDNAQLINNDTSKVGNNNEALIILPSQEGRSNKNDDFIATDINTAFGRFNVEKELENSKTNIHFDKMIDPSFQTDGDSTVVINESPSSTDTPQVPTQTKDQFETLPPAVLKDQNICEIGINAVNNNDVPQTFKEGYKIEHIDDDSECGLQKCVRIKLASGRIFKATIVGDSTVNFDSLFDDPVMKSSLLGGISTPRKYTINIKQVTTSDKCDPKKIVGTQVQEIIITPRANYQTFQTSRDVEFVNLLSDDERDPDDEDQILKTEYGIFKITKIDTDMLKKHQVKINQKCSVRLVREALTQKQSKEEKIIYSKTDANSKSSNRTVNCEAEKVNNVNKTIESSDQSEFVEIIEMKKATDQPIAKILSKNVSQDKSLLRNFHIPAQEIIEIDDSSKDSVDLDFVCALNPKDTSKLSVNSDPIGKVIVLKDQLLKRQSEEAIVDISANECLDMEIISLCDDKDDPQPKKTVTPLISDKTCYVKLTRCDGLVKKYDEIANKKCFVELVRYEETMQNKDIDDNVNTETTELEYISSNEELILDTDNLPEISLLNDSTLTKSSRSGSISILDDFTIFDVNISNSIENEFIERSSSPVIDVFDTIAAFQNFQEICNSAAAKEHAMDLKALHVTCECEWRLTKNYLNVQAKTIVLENRTFCVSCVSEWTFTKPSLHLLLKVSENEVVSENLTTEPKAMTTFASEICDGESSECTPIEIEGLLTNVETLGLETDVINEEVTSNLETTIELSPKNILVPKLLTLVSAFFQENPDLVYRLKPNSKRKCTPQECTPVVRKMSRIKMRPTKIIEHIIGTNVDTTETCTRKTKNTVIHEDVSKSEIPKSDFFSNVENAKNLETSEMVKSGVKELSKKTSEIELHDKVTESVTIISTSIEIPLPTAVGEGRQDNKAINNIANDCDFLADAVLSSNVVKVCDVIASSNDIRDTNDNGIFFRNEAYYDNTTTLPDTDENNSDYDHFNSDVNTLSEFAVSVVVEVEKLIVDKHSDKPDEFEASTDNNYSKSNLIEVGEKSTFFNKSEIIDTETLINVDLEKRGPINKVLRNVDHEYISYATKTMDNSKNIMSGKGTPQPVLVNLMGERKTNKKYNKVMCFENSEFEHEIEVFDCSNSIEDSKTVSCNLSEQKNTGDNIQAIRQNIEDQNIELNLEVNNKVGGIKYDIQTEPATEPNVHEEIVNLRQHSNEIENNDRNKNREQEDGCIINTVQNVFDSKKNTLAIKDTLHKENNYRTTEHKNPESRSESMKLTTGHNDAENSVHNSENYAKVEGINLKDNLHRNISEIELCGANETKGVEQRCENVNSTTEDIHFINDNIENVGDSKEVESCTAKIENSIDKQVTLIYKDNSGLVLNGIEYEDPEAGTCYIFPLLHKNLESGEEDNDSPDNIMCAIHELSGGTKEKDNIISGYESDYELIIPKLTYAEKKIQNIVRERDNTSCKRNLKRKIDMSDVRMAQKRYRKGKNIDAQKLAMAALKETVYANEYKRLISYCSSIKFTYARPFHKEYIDVHQILADWPIKDDHTKHSEENIDSEIDQNLFIDIDNYDRSEVIKDPWKLTLAEELEALPNETLCSSENNDSNFNMGFGEGSGRVKLNFKSQDDISKLSATTLSDVKQPEPFLMSVTNDACVKSNRFANVIDDRIKALRRYTTYIELRERVRSFFQNTSIQLSNNSVGQYGKANDLNKYDTSRFPYGLNSTEFFYPSSTDAIVHVVQIGQLPVSAAAQNPVTCDPRVTQVSDASPSQCSAESSPNDDPQSPIKTEYTELTTADLNLPLVQNYVNHNQNIAMKPQESRLPEIEENIPIQTEIKSEVKIELMEETLDEREQNESNELINQHYLQDKVDVNHADFSYETSNTNMNPELNSNMQIIFNSTEKQPMLESFPQNKQHNGLPEKIDQIAHAMNAAGITTTTEAIDNSGAQALVNMLSQKLCQGGAAAQSTANLQSTTNNFPKTSSISALALQQALAQILPPPLNQTNVTENQQASNNTGAPQLLHFVQEKSATGNQITLVDSSQSSNGTPVLHIVQNNSNNTGTTNGTPGCQSNIFGGISLVDTGLQQGGNQLLQIVNTGNQKSNAAGQLLKRVNLLANLAGVQGSNEQTMLQFVCKSADGKPIQLNAPHQRSMVLRLQPIETPAAPKDPETSGPNSTSQDTVISQNEIKSRSVYEENYAKFIQNSSSKPTAPEKSTSLPKFNQAFGKQGYQDGSQKQNEMSNGNSHLTHTNAENSECQPQDTTLNVDHIGSPPLLIRKSQTATSQQQQQQQPSLVQQIKQTIAPMNLQTMHGGVIYTRQIPVNIGGGQTINLITVPSTELLDDNGQKPQTGEIEPSIIKIVPQNQPTTNADVSTSEDTQMGVTNDNTHNHQPQPVLTQMRIKLPMLSKAPQMMSGARVVRPSFFQIQRNVIGGANQSVYQQLVLAAAPPLGQQTIRLPQTQTPRSDKVSTENQSPTESQMSSSTLEQLREFDLVLEQVKERSTVQPNSSTSTTFANLHTPPTDTTDSAASVPPTSSTPTETSQQSLFSGGSTHEQPLNASYVNRKSTVTAPTTSTYVRSPDSSGIIDSPSSSTHEQIPNTVTTEPSSSETPTQPKPSKSGKSKSKSKSSSNPPSAVKVNTTPPKTSNQKPLEDEQTTQRILYILAEYKEQVERSPDKDKPAPRRRNNLPTNPCGSSKRKKSGSRRSGRDMSPILGEDSNRTMGSEDSSCGTSQGDCNESCMDSHSPQDSPRKVARKLTFEQETPTQQPRPQPQRNVIVADGQTITVARGTAGKPATAVLMPANYILPVSMVKGGQQIAIMTNRGPKLLTVGGGEGGTTNALLLQRLIGPAGLKPVLTRPGVRHVRLPTAALHNLQTFNFATTTTIQPPDRVPSAAAAPAPPGLIETRAKSFPWARRESRDGKSNRGSSPERSEPWNLRTSSDPPNFNYGETVRPENMNRTVLDPIPDRYSPDMEAQRIFDKMFDVESKKSYVTDSHEDSPRCGYDIDTSDCDDKPYQQVVHKKEGPPHRQHRLTHVSAAALRHKYAVLEHELRLQKSLSEECEDLGVDSPSASELFPEAELLFSSSPAHDHNQEQVHHTHTPQSTILSCSNSSSNIQPDIDDQIATDHLLQREIQDDRQDLNLGLEDVGIVTVRSDGMQASIALDPEEFARAHPNTTFHSEPPDATEVQPYTITGIGKGRQITSTIFHANRTPATVLMPPQTTVISQATAEPRQQVKYADIDNMINSLPTSHTNNINLSSVLVKDDGLTRYDSILTDSREVHLSNTASAIIHSTGNATQVIRRVCYDDHKRERDNRFLMDEHEGLIAGNDAKMVAEDSRDAVECINGRSPERHAELFWESNSVSERSECRRPLDFSSDSDKCCKSPSYDEMNSTDSSGVGTHMRLDSVIKEARGIDRGGSAEGSSADDTHPPLRTYPPKRMYHTTEGLERSTSGKTRAGDHSPVTGQRRRASGRGVVKRGCHCCNGSPAPLKPKKSRLKKPAMDFSTST